LRERSGGWSPSNTLWASFDDTEGRRVSRERHIEGGDRLSEPLQRQAAEVFNCDQFLYCCSDAAGDQDLTILCFSTEPGDEVAHGADRGIAGALRKADLAQRRVALGDACAKAQLTIAPALVGDQRPGGLTHRYRHFDGALGRVGDRDRIVEEHHDPIARELVECSLELADQRP
jgi:hypothetical protein